MKEEQGLMKTKTDNGCPECGEPLDFYSDSNYMGVFEGMICSARCGFDKIENVDMPGWMKLEELSEREFYEQEVLGVGKRDKYGSL